MMEVGELISFYRRQCGMTIDELAEKSGVAKGTLNKIMGGATKAPTLDNMKAIARALGKRLADFDDEPELADMFSPSEQAHIKKYRLLDPYGKEAVDGVLDVESRRCQAERDKQAAILREQREEMEVAEEIAPPITLHQPFAQVAAAEGAGAFLLDDGFDEVLVEMNKYTKQADVILKVVGRSMEPVIADGDRVLVRQQPSVRIGEIGVFVVDGQGYLKEYQADRLVSLNPNIDDVLVGDLQSAECYGKFIKVLNPDWVK
jgi:SOS-response transcriptional repressor LexA